MYSHSVRGKLVLELFSFMGRFLGLAISCGERLDISFAPHVARYLMGQPANISDLRFLDPDLYKQLVDLLRLKKERQLPFAVFMIYCLRNLVFFPACFFWY